jgi:ribonuclease-3
LCRGRSGEREGSSSRRAFVPAMAEQSLRDLERVLGYTFRHRRWLEQALTHGSSREDLPPGTPVQDYERLEFLGDAVLDLIVAEHLMRTEPEWDEGQMTKARSKLVSRRGLEAAVSRLGIAPYVRAGPGLERADERGKKRVLADVYEALVGAIYMDSGGVPAAEGFVRVTLLGTPAPARPAPPPERAAAPRAPERRAEPRRPVAVPRVARSVARPPARPILRAQRPEAVPQPTPSKGDFKSALQDLLQRQGQPRPVYRVLREVGPEHQKTWFVEVQVPPHLRATGKGSTKKKAEQRAAQNALAQAQGAPRAEKGRSPHRASRRSA